LAKQAEVLLWVLGGSKAKEAVGAILFSNGTVGIFDKEGDQIPGIQESWLRLWLNYMESLGADPAYADPYSREWQGLFHSCEEG
jgi:hypothetical protein